VKVSLHDKREFDAEIVLKDALTDLAVLRIQDSRERFQALDFADSDALQVGDVVLAIGNPFGIGQTVTHGIVSALARTQIGISDYQFFIQTDAAINPGNSGGALVDLSGKLVGINTAIFSRSGGSQGIGFAIPAQYGPRGGRFREDRRHCREAPLARSPPASCDAGDCREPRP
jgi:S1-C subfamily serine protease